MRDANPANPLKLLKDIIMQNDFADAQSTDAKTIPVIDVSGAISGDGINDVADAIYNAATNHGFFYISNHGIDPILMEQAFAVSKAFFELPEVDKQAIAVDRNQRGWLGQGMSRMQGSKTHDLKEVFFWGPHTEADDVDVLACKPLCAMNQWPKDFPRLYEDLIPYYDPVCQMARRVMAAVAVSLDQPANFFDKAYAKPLARGQMVYYPASTQDDAEARFGVALTRFRSADRFVARQQWRTTSASEFRRLDRSATYSRYVVCNIGDLWRDGATNDLPQLYIASSTVPATPAIPYPFLIHIQIQLLIRSILAYLPTIACLNQYALENI